MSRPSSSHRHPPHTERRKAKRRKPDELLWLKELCVSGRRGQLVDISSDGVYFETGSRLLLGRRTVVLLTTTDKKCERLEGVTIRSELVAVDRSGSPVYRTAVMFASVLDMRDAENSSSPCAQVSVDLATRRVELGKEAA